MDITVTEKIKLLEVTPEISAEFETLTKKFAEACDEVSQYIFENGFPLEHKKRSTALLCKRQSAGTGIIRTFFVSAPH